MLALGSPVHYFPHRSFTHALSAFILQPLKSKSFPCKQTLAISKQLERLQSLHVDPSETKSQKLGTRATGPVWRPPLENVLSL